MPLRHRDNAFIPEARGVTFVMSDVGVRDVVCIVDGDALIAAARECGLPSADHGMVFQNLRRAIEACASDIYDRDGRAPVVIHAMDLLA